MGETSPTKPDRNLALELVRVTEAAALAAARWVGRGDKIAADQAAVDAMRFVLDSVSMDGVVVIGEGEKDEAPMLYNGEQIGDGSPPVVDIAVDPLEGTRLCALGMPSALAVIALAERGIDVRPGPLRLHGEDRRRRGDRRPARPRPAAARDAEADRRAQGRQRRRRDRRHARPPPPRGGDARGARGGRPHPPDHRRRRLRRAARRQRPLAGRPALGDRRHSRGRALRRGAEVDGRASCSAASGRATTRSAARRSTPATTSTASSPPTTSAQARTSSSPPPASPTATSCRASATAAPAPPPNRS